MQRILASLALTILISACSEVPREAFFDRGQPESLMDYSSEVVNFRLQDAGSIAELSDMINQDQPTRAELYCLESDRTCTKAKKALKQFGVPVQFIPAADNRATLVYERVVARDCENRFIDNHINPYNLYHPTFGCSVASNIVQHVTDKQEFFNPNLTDYPDAERAVVRYGTYLKGPSKNPEDFDNSSLDDIRTAE